MQTAQILALLARRGKREKQNKLQPAPTTLLSDKFVIIFLIVSSRPSLSAVNKKMVSLFPQMM